MILTRNNITAVAMAVVLIVAGVTVAHGGNYGHGYGHMKSMDIVHTAIKSGSFNTLVAALQAADLTETLMTEGPFTVFAPTDEAFAKLPDGTLEELLKPENKSKLQQILTYHVVSGKVMAVDVITMTTAETVQGQNLTIDISDGVKIDDANVIRTDVMASNGVIHIIDRVIMPN